MTGTIGRLMGIEDLTSIQSWRVKFAAPWAEGRPALVLFACAAMVALAVFFYFRFQRSQLGNRRGLGFLAALRAMVLVLLVAILAEPVISMTITERPRPLLLVLFDGSDSMNLVDNRTTEELAELAKVTSDENEPGAGDLADASRIDLVRRVLNNDALTLFSELSEDFRVRAFVMDERDEVREIDATPDRTEQFDTAEFDAARVAEQLSAEGDVTALGTALEQLARRHRSSSLAGAVVFSDYVTNSGAPPERAAERLGKPIFAVGLGPEEVVDLKVDFGQVDKVLKKDEAVTVEVQLEAAGLSGQAVRVELLGRRLSDIGGASVGGQMRSLAEAKTVELDDGTQVATFSFTPEETGRMMLETRVEPLAGEVLPDNNSDQREVVVHDQALNLLFVEYEPTWEWRFVKEVFHRDPLIGREGFRTFLRSADFKVRRNNELFLETLARPRSEFFAYDVIFLSDVPGEMLSEHFQDMVEEYVKEFGGGLVVIGGPRFGVGALAGTKIGDMLPVIVDSSTRPREGDFVLRRTRSAAEESFMSLADNEQENEYAWSLTGPLPWYHPVTRKHPGAVVLAEHPRDTTADGETPQPIIAKRTAGKGTVVYVGVNEMWRLRKKWGEKYYRKFWGQMIYQLGLDRVLGSQKRFLVSTDLPSYRAGDDVQITIDAFTEDFEVLDEEQLEARLIPPPTAGASEPIELTVPRVRDALYETQIPLDASGDHRLLVRDPVTGEEVETNIRVAPRAVERQRADRDVALQQKLAQQTGGRAYDLSEITSLASDISVPTVEVERERSFELWNTWLVLILVLILMCGEWLTRKLYNMR